MAAIAGDMKSKVLQAEPGPSLRSSGFDRNRALYCLVFGLLYWSGWFGFYEGNNMAVST